MALLIARSEIESLATPVRAARIPEPVVSRPLAGTPEGGTGQLSLEANSLTNDLHKPLRFFYL